MALATSDFRDRIDSDLVLLGNFTPTQKNNVIKDALTEFCRVVDPVISSTISVVTGTTEYNFPADVRRISAVYDADGVEAVYSLDDYRRKITLSNTPSASETYTVYGVPLNPRTNYETIISTMTAGGDNEDCGDVLWQLIRVGVHKLANSGSASNEAVIARQMMKEMRQSRNRNDDIIGQVLQVRDVQGSVIDDTGNLEGRNVDIDDYLKNDLV